MFRAVVESLSERFNEAAADYQQIERSSAPPSISARIQARGRDFDTAWSTIVAIAQADTGTGRELYTAAQACAWIAAVIRSDRVLAAAQREQLGEKFSKQAVEWLDKSQSLKFLSSPSTRFLLADDHNLASLRSRDDFRALVARSREAPRTAK